MPAPPNIDSINVLSELEHYKITFEYTGSDDEVKTICPFHADETPSCFINVNKKLFICHTAGCEKSGDIVSLIAAKAKKSRAEIFVELAQRYSLEDTPENIIDFRTVERYYSTEIPNILKNELYKRAITDEDIRYYRIGYDSTTKRITIPIRNSEGLFCNIRKYLPGAPGSDKFKNTKGHGKNRLFPYEQLKYQTIIICGGEIKAILAARLLNPHNIGAITLTCGEGNWDKDFNEYFSGKDVIHCLDVDEDGKKASNIRAKLLNNIVKSNRILTLPLDLTKYPKGDINDYIGQENKTAEDLLQLLSDEQFCKSYSPINYKELDNNDTVIKLHLSQAIASKNVSKRVAVSCSLSSIDTAPFVVPKNIYAICDRSQKVCSVCNIFRNKENELYEINTESSSLLELVHSRKTQHRDALMQLLSIPKKCPIVEFHANEYNNYEDARISPQLEITDRAADRFLQPSLIKSDDDNKLELNESYEFTGRNWPHPNSQQSTLILSDYKQTTDALSNFKLTEEYKDKLKCFMPEDRTITAIQSVLDRIYADFSANITKIYGRSELHLAIDLVYHSPLFINFDGNNDKGWAEILILGDSAQGKSRVAIGLKEFYQLGEKVESKNATVAGLLGGLQKTGDRWFVSWGLFPNQDKRLIILEELKGMHQETFAKLTDMRSSGLAEIPKIEKRRTHARTRMIAISNTKSGRELSSYTYGIKAIEELIGSIEDVRRFDFALILSNKDVDKEIINIPSSKRTKIEHTFHTDLCRNLILWTWTANCKFAQDAEEEIFRSASTLSDKFHDSIPLVDKGSTRLKLARLSAALAARLFSHDSEYNILVEKCHVEYITKFITDVYSRETFGYARYTEAIIESQKLKDEKEIIHELQHLKDPKEFCRKMLNANGIDYIDIADFAGCDRERANNLGGILVRKNAIYRASGRYYKNTQFTERLKYWSNNGVLETKPDYIKKKQQQEAEKF